MNYGSQLLGTGIGLPETVVPNSYFESFLETSDEWIRTRTGIETRRIADPEKGETTATLALKAARQALEKARVTPAEIDMVVVGTVTPDTVMPCTANQVQNLLGATRTFSFDLQAACSGFLYGMHMADALIRTGSVKTALIIGAETLSTIIDWRDRGTCVLFGDGAGAAVFRRTEGEQRILSTRLYADPAHGDLLQIPHGYSKCPPYSAEYRSDMHKVKMEGRDIFKHAVRNMVDASVAVLRDNNLKTSEVDFFIFHQANMRIIDMCAKTLDVPTEKMWLNVAKYGNTSAATLPVALHEAIEAGAIRPGNRVLMATFGGGLTWASTLLRV